MGTGTCRRVNILIQGRTWAIALCVVLLNNTALAQHARPFSQLIELWTRQLDRIQDLMQKGDLLPIEIDSARTHLLDVRRAAAAAANRARTEFTETRSLMAVLEDSPKALPLETDAIKAERGRMVEMAATSEGRARQAELVVARADILFGLLTDARSDAVFRQWFSRFAFFQPDSMRNSTTEGLLRARQRVAAEATEWKTRLENLKLSRLATPQLTALVIVTFALWLVTSVLQDRDKGKDRPLTNFSRPASTALDIVNTLVIPVLTAYALQRILVAVNPLWLGRISLVEHVFGALLGFGLTSVALSPRPGGRLLPVTDASALHLRQALRRLILVAVVLHFATGTIAYAAGASVFEAVGVLLNTIVITTVSLPVLYTRAWYAIRPNGSQLPSVVGGAWWSVARMAIGTVLLFALGLASLGYYALADHLTQALFATALMLASSLVLHCLLSDALTAAVSFNSRSGKWIRQRFGFAPESKLHGHHIAILLLDVALGAGLIILVPIAWGADEDAVLRGLGQLFAGTRVGGVKISLRDVAVAIVSFGLCLTAVKVLRNVVRTRLLPTIDASVPLRQSVDAVLNYAGVTIAIFVGIGALGLDFTNLAIVIGALSVGIGLGLQNIANNVVSGVFLLVERPIKAGDWIAVVGHEGVVRRISIRATEIETLQRTHVFVPNSTFLQNPVINRTYLDASNRLDIPVSVGLAADIDTIEGILCNIALEHPGVMREPPPTVRFLRVTPNGLDFELLVFVSRIEDRVVVSNDIIKQVFRKLIDLKLLDPSQKNPPLSIAERLPGVTAAPPI